MVEPHGRVVQLGWPWLSCFSGKGGRCGTRAAGRQGAGGSEALREQGACSRAWAGAPQSWGEPGRTGWHWSSLPRKGAQLRASYCLVREAWGRPGPKGGGSGKAPPRGSGKPGLERGQLALGGEAPPSCRKLLSASAAPPSPQPRGESTWGSWDSVPTPEGNKASPPWGGEVLGRRRLSLSPTAAPPLAPNRGVSTRLAQTREGKVSKRMGES